MSIVGSEQWMYASGGGSFYPVTIDNSLRWPASGCQLFRTVGTPTDAKKHTHSFWVKVNPDTTQTLNSVYANQSGYYSNSGINSDGRIIFAADYARYYYSTMVLRDPSSWVHILQVLDSTEASNSDRMKLYVNGVRQTSFTNFATVPLNWTGSYHATNGFGLRIGRTYTGAGFSSSLLSYTSEYIFVDGQALDPTDFGQFQDGVWIPDTYAGTYGNNGYKLDFSNPANFGEDSSGNSNDFSVTGLAAHDAMPDTPTNNFATYNSNVNTGQTGTYAEGNLAVTASSFWSSNVWRQGSIGVTGGTGGGKYYFEFVSTLGGSGQATGVAVQSSSAIDTTSHNDGVIYYYLSVKTGSTVTVSGITNNPAYDVLRFAFDASNGKVWIGNSTGWFNSGDPAAGTGESGTITNYDGSILVPVTNRSSTAGTHTFNFGQDSTFAGLKTSGSANGSDGNGIGDFYYAVPSGFLTLCTANLPTPTIIDGSENFVPYIYTADGTSPKSRTGLGFSPDFLWFKDRTVALSHALYDTIRGPNKGLQTNTTNAENSYNALNSFDADGFTTITDGVVGNLLNNSTDSYVTWAWKAGGTAVSNTDGSITSQVSANVDAGFSIVSWTGTGANATVGHGLAEKPQFIFAKNRNGTPDAWPVYSETIGAANRLYLNLTSSSSASATIWNNTEPTAQVFSVGSASLINQSTKDIIAYCFHSVEGFSKAGSYTGNGTNQFIHTGFRPAFVLAKATSAADNWRMYDSARIGYNPNNSVLYPNLSNAEDSPTNHIDLLSNGFRWMSDNNNANGHTFIYLAFAEHPFKYANAR